MSLKGLTVLELAGLAPSPYCGLILQQHGADVIRIDRHTGPAAEPTGGAMDAGKKSIALDLKSTQGRQVFLRLCKAADVLIDCYRPGVMEKLGLGPADVRQVNRGLIYARLTGWGQSGPMAMVAGHDLNYIGLTGAVASANFSFPNNLLGDFAGGGMLCAMGIMMALFERHKSGEGQVLDVAMVDGVAHLATYVYRMRHCGAWSEAPGTNVLDGGAPWYGCHLCKDGKYVAVGCIEERFYQLLLKGLGLDKEKSLPKQMDRERWPELRARLAARFLTKTRDEWVEVFSEDLADACCTPVLTIAEVQSHPHMAARNVIQQGPLGRTDVIPAPAPRMSRTPGVPSPMGKGAVPRVGQDTRELLKGIGYSSQDIDDLLASGSVVHEWRRNKARL